jgi:pilus assembly protein TadC
MRHRRADDRGMATVWAAITVAALVALSTAVLGLVAAVGGRHRAEAAEARAQRAGVLIAAPLGLCFLPAFLVLGVVPVVIGLAGEVLPQW